MTWQEKLTNHPFAVLAFSIVTEVLATTSMKISQGFSVMPYTAICIALFICSLAGLVFALKNLPLGLAYGIWGGVGTTLTTLIGIALWGDAFNVSIVIGIVLVIGGIILLNRGQKQGA
ncbi:MAG: multidrug efflux SMR transporter [Phoenicibacter congonensis]|uniref:Multidrug efflux SMR transporter n=1 Tax=Phoenicibacter congonensis TaxID=1944646 RepID=A0AA43U6V6_9ACTN|nr:multidrug efflux SMR transporter [Phoenicibacter congonensis]